LIYAQNKPFDINVNGFVHISRFLHKPGSAKRRLADEYDAAQERGDIASRSDGDRSSKAVDLKPTISDIGLTHKDPGIVRRTLDGTDSGERRSPLRAIPGLDGFCQSARIDSRLCALGDTWTRKVNEKFGCSRSARLSKCRFSRSSPLRS
jgi:hypothetical protein